MKFIIERTSLFMRDMDRPPCDEAFKGTWTLKGYESIHSAWFIELNTLEDLTCFAKKYEQLVVSLKDISAEDYICIEIYDSYRE